MVVPAMQEPAGKSERQLIKNNSKLLLYRFRLKCPDVIKSISTGSRSLCIITKDEDIYVAKDIKFNILGKITTFTDTKNWKKNWTKIQGYLKQIHVYDPILRY